MSVTVLAWGWFAVCELFGLLVLFPIGLVVVGAACVFKAWRFPYATSIKPLPDRKLIDGWAWSINLLYGNPEDGVSGVDAYGPSWIGSYNPSGTRWRALLWNLRNWANGFSYLTWAWTSAPPLYVKPYTIFGRQRQLKIGWQQLPPSDGWVTNKVRMVCSA